MRSVYVLKRKYATKAVNANDKQQLCLKASQKTELCTLLELSAASSAGKNDVKRKAETYTHEK